MVILIVLAFYIGSVGCLLIASINGDFTAWLYRCIFVGDIIERP